MNRQKDRQTDRQTDRQGKVGTHQWPMLRQVQAVSQVMRESPHHAAAMTTRYLQEQSTPESEHKSSAQTMVQLLKLHTSLRRQTPFTQVMRDAEWGPESEQKATPYYLLHYNDFIKFMYQIHKAFSSAICHAYCD